MAIARSSHGLTQGGMVTKLAFSERAFKELNISMATSTDKERVVALTLPVVK